MIEIAGYDPRWPEQFEAESARLREALGSLAMRIEHNGSTSVPGLAAKPVIDIQISVASLQPLSAYEDPLGRLGYGHVPHADDAFCPFFHRPHNWPHTHHVHIVEYGGLEEQRTLGFRDYLRSHPHEARAYEALKRQLAGQAHDASHEARERYADAKTAFIERVIAVALQLRT